MTAGNVKRGRTKLALLGLTFLAPLIAAAWLYLTESSLAPRGRTNAGALLEPIINIEAETGESLERLTDGASRGRWVLIYADPAPCLDSCREELYRMRQARLMLGNDMSRLVRLFLHGENTPDTVWLNEQHAGLTTIRNEALMSALQRYRPGDGGSGGLFLVDPLGNLVMHFANELDARRMVDDIEHLLELSRIG